MSIDAWLAEQVPELFMLGAIDPTTALAVSMRCISRRTRRLRFHPRSRATPPFNAWMGPRCRFRCCSSPQTICATSSSRGYLVWSI
jgi:hypothetical protein